MEHSFELNTGIYQLAKLDFYTEGPAVDTVGNVYFSTLSGGDILKIHPGGKISTWAKSSCPNGHIILSDGDHLVCDSKLASVRRFDNEGNFLKDVVKGVCANEEVFVPNDLLMAPFGNLIFTDSVRSTGKVFVVGANRQKVLAKNLDYPNGLAVSPNGRWLYVAESFKNRVLKFDISDIWNDCEKYTVFADLPKNISGKDTDNLPDGLTVDTRGNIWVAHYGMGCIHKYSPDGGFVTSIKTGMPLTSNLIFANENAAIVTGGFGEPGPGSVLKISV